MQHFEGIEGIPGKNPVWRFGWEQYLGYEKGAGRHKNDGVVLQVAELVARGAQKEVPPMGFLVVIVTGLKGDFSAQLVEPERNI